MDDVQLIQHGDDGVHLLARQRTVAVESVVGVVDTHVIPACVCDRVSDTLTVLPPTRKGKCNNQFVYCAVRRLWYCSKHLHTTTYTED